MKKIRITYRMEVYINAETKEKAEEIFENMSNEDLFNKSDFVEVNSVEDENEF